MRISGFEILTCPRVLRTPYQQSRGPRVTFVMTNTHFSPNPARHTGGSTLRSANDVITSLGAILTLNLLEDATLFETLQSALKVITQADVV